MPKPSKTMISKSGNRPEDVGVDRGQQPQRKEDRAGQAAQNGQQQCQGEDQHFGDEEEPDVYPERVDDLRERVVEYLGVEEVVLNRRPAGSVDDDDRQQAEEDDAADERNGGRLDGGSVDPPAGTRRPARLEAQKLPRVARAAR